MLCSVSIHLGLCSTRRNLKSVPVIGTEKPEPQSETECLDIEKEREQRFGRGATSPKYLQGEVLHGKSQMAARGSLPHGRRMHCVLLPHRSAPLGCHESPRHWPVSPVQAPSGQKPRRPEAPTEAPWSGLWCLWRVRRWWCCLYLGSPGGASLGPSIAGLLCPGSGCRGGAPLHGALSQAGVNRQLSVSHPCS